MARLQAHIGMNTRTTLFRLTPGIFAVLVALTGCQSTQLSAQALEESSSATTEAESMIKDDLPKFQDSQAFSDAAKNTAGDAVANPAVNSTSEPAVVFGASIASDDLVVQVLSNGCTQQADFELQYGEAENNQLSVTVLRTKPDLCRKMPALVDISLPLDPQRVDGNTVVLNNKITEKPVLKRK